MPSAPLTAAARENIRAIRDLEAEVSARRTRVDRATDAVTGFVGSFKFLIAQAVVVLGWIGVNMGFVPGVRALDPFPFEFLNFLVGIEAILLSTFVLMTQNRQNATAEQWGHVQLQVALLAEQESTKVLEMLQLMCTRLGLDQAARDPELREMIRTTHVHELARELETTRQEAAAPAVESTPTAEGNGPPAASP